MMDQNHNVFFFAAIDRPWVMEPHEFYVKEAKRRLLSQFSDIELENEAHEKEQQFMDYAESWFNPDYHDEADVHEAAQQAGILQWIAMHDMKVTVTLALTAGMYHQFDKALRDLTIRETRHWNWLEKRIQPEMIWNMSFGYLIDMLEWAGIEIRTKGFWPITKNCQQVVNVYKHGDGAAHRQLAKNCPEYYWKPTGNRTEITRIPGYQQLLVNEAQFSEFADAITQFWNNLPEGRSYSQMGKKPGWFDKECGKYESK